jgi:uncharacterized protein YndB with AHSA1/START domain
MNNQQTIKRNLLIDAPATKVWDVLTNPIYNIRWGNAFSEGPWVESDWQVGSSVVWKDSEGNVGAKGIVKTNDPCRLLQVVFYDEPRMEPPAPLGDYIESYALNAINDKTELIIESGPLPREHFETHSLLWDKAAAKIKDLAEA